MRDDVLRRPMPRVQGGRVAVRVKQQASRTVTRAAKETAPRRRARRAIRREPEAYAHLRRTLRLWRESLDLGMKAVMSSSPQFFAGTSEVMRADVKKSRRGR